MTSAATMALDVISTRTGQLISWPSTDIVDQGQALHRSMALTMGMDP